MFCKLDLPKSFFLSAESLIFVPIYIIRMETSKIEIKDAVLRQGAEEGMDEFIKVFTDKYLEVTGGVINAETMPLLNGYQHSLLGYHFFREEIGPYIFDNPFAKSMRLFGAKEFSKLVYNAKKIYDENRADLEKDCDDEEFMAMYEQYEVFDELEEQFMDMEELVTAQIAEYVDNNIEQFAEIVE